MLGRASAWNPKAIGDEVRVVAVSGSTLYAGGPFRAIGAVARNHIAALDTTTGRVTAWNPNASATVTTLPASGSTVYASGSFRSIGGRTRTYICAGRHHRPRNRLEPERQLHCEHAGGVRLDRVRRRLLRSIGTAARDGLAALDAATGTATAWDPKAGSPVTALKVSGSTVYVGGKFETIGCKPGSCINDRAPGWPGRGNVRLSGENAGC